MTTSWARRPLWVNQLGQLSLLPLVGRGMSSIAVAGWMMLLAAVSPSSECLYEGKADKISKSNYFIVRPKVDQRTGLLSLPHLGNFRRTHAHHICLYFVSIHQRATTGAQRCAPLVRLLTTHLPTPEGWKAELA